MSFVIPSGAKESLSHDIADYPDGIVLPIDKPYRWTSADVIRKVKFAAFRHFRKKNLKVGHAGTLDPLATGVLLVCIGPACKRAQELQDHDKEYVAGIRFGATTPSYDLEKEVDRTFPYDGVTEDALRAVLPSFLGTPCRMSRRSRSASTPPNPPAASTSRRIPNPACAWSPARTSASWSSWTFPRV